MERYNRRRFVSLVAILTLASLLLIPGIAPADQEQDRKLETWIRESFPKSKIEYQNITFGQDDYQAKLQHVIITPDDGPKPLAIDEITFYRVDTDHNPPYFIKASVRGIHLTPDHMDGDIRKTFKAREIEEIPVDADLDLQYDEKNRHLALKKLELTADQYGRLSLALALDSFYLWNADNKTTFIGFLVGIPSIGFKSADVDFTDDGLVHFVITNRAKKTKKTEEEVLAEMISEIDEDIQNARTENAKQNLGELKKFLLDPGQIRITIHPENAIKIREIKKIEDGVIDYAPLGLTVRANQ